MQELNQKQSDYNNQIKHAVLWLVIGVLGRLIPHIPNVTPMTSLSLFAGRELSRGKAILLLLATLFISDVALAYLMGYPVVSWWSCFTYSGFIAMALISSWWLRGSSTKMRLPVFILSSSFGFWLWTNFGVWLTSTLYPKSVTGLIICYTAALPFLRTALLGDVAWGIVIFGGYYLVQRKILGIGKSSLVRF